MNLNEEYGLDAFCQGLITNWPEVSLTLRRAEDKVFVTAGALGQLAIAVSRPEELVGSCVRRAVVELHAKLVVADQAVAAVAAGSQRADLKAAMLRLIAASEVVDGSQDKLDAIENVLVTLRDNPAAMTDEDFEILKNAKHVAELHKDCQANLSRIAEEVEALRATFDDDEFDLVHEEVEDETGFCVFEIL